MRPADQGTAGLRAAIEPDHASEHNDEQDGETPTHDASSNSCRRHLDPRVSYEPNVNVTRLLTAAPAARGHAARRPPGAPPLETAGARAARRSRRDGRRPPRAVA